MKDRYRSGVYYSVTSDRLAVLIKPHVTNLRNRITGEMRIGVVADIYIGLGEFKNMEIENIDNLVYIGKFE